MIYTTMVMGVLYFKVNNTAYLKYDPLVMSINP